MIAAIKALAAVIIIGAAVIAAPVIGGILAFLGTILVIVFVGWIFFYILLEHYRDEPDQ